MNKYKSILMGIIKCSLGIVAAVMLLRQSIENPLLATSYLAIFSFVFLMSGVLELINSASDSERIKKFTGVVSVIVLFMAGLIALVDIFQHKMGYDSMPIEVSITLFTLFFILGIISIPKR